MALSAWTVGRAGLAVAISVLAVAEARSALGTPTMVILGTGFLAFDLLLCAAGGIVADAIVGRRPS